MAIGSPGLAQQQEHVGRIEAGSWSTRSKQDLAGTALRRPARLDSDTDVMVSFDGGPRPDSGDAERVRTSRRLTGRQRDRWLS
jgi:predicted nucleotidyltransferase